MILPFVLAASIVVDPGQVLGRITPQMYGACIEDVNHEIYGGLYAQRIFGESFEEPAPQTSPLGWRILDGTWTPDGSAIHVRGGRGPKLLRDVRGLGDGTVEAEIEISNDGGENAGLLVRVSNAGVGADDFDGYEISLSGKRRQILLGKHRHDFQALQTVDAPVEAGRWHRLRVAMDGPRLQIYLDAETAPRIDYIDTDRPFTGGSFALRAWAADASFRNVRFGGQTIPISLAGDGVSGLWDRVLTGSVQARYRVEEGAFNGELCQRIQNLGGMGTAGIANRGLNRGGISVRQGHPMEGRIYLHGDVATVTVALQSADGSHTYAAQTLKVGAHWSKAEFRLRPRVTDPNARFALWIDRPGTIWADQAILLDASQDRFKGLPIRKDIAQEMVASGLTFLRYGGTMVNVPGYRWKNMIGDPDRRPPYAGHWYPCSTNGFGIFDFLRFCEKAKFGAAFAMNADESPEDAADLAEYLVGPATSAWGRRRVQDGHPAPYKLDYLEIGNEEAIGNSDVVAMARYAQKFQRLATAIHSRGPHIKLVCAAWWVPDAPETMKTVFDAIDRQAAAWDLHFWSDDPRAGSSIDRELNRARLLFSSWNPKTTLKAVVFEENGNRHDQQRALGHATTLNATRRHSDFVLADSAANGLQPWRQNDNGWDQGQVFFDSAHAWSMPPALVQRLLASDRLPLRVAATTEGNLDVLATRSEDGRTVVLTAVNATDHSVETRILLKDFVIKTAKIGILSGPLHSAENDSGSHVAFSTSTLKTDGSQGKATLPPYSVASIRLERGSR